MLLTDDDVSLRTKEKKNSAEEKMKMISGDMKRYLWVTNPPSCLDLNIQGTIPVFSIIHVDQWQCMIQMAVILRKNIQSWIFLYEDQIPLYRSHHQILYNLT